ncbi:MAG: peptide-methionine (S)-S-oxide reductase MsrA [Alphaproteobacteria bacterium]|nr:peptide-methionine (S)-S-oxide reductase MsrA [Alphaproteobacteria bacterium]
MPQTSSFCRPVLILAALMIGGGIALRGVPSAAGSAHAISPPAHDEPENPAATSEVAVLAGGSADTAHYEMVGTNTTGHAESVQVTFDPRRISYGRILQIYFSVAHDPTELNRQGPDVGRQYRSAIFPTNPQQARIADDYIAQLNGEHVFDVPIATKIESGRGFYPAENYHQDFLARNSQYPYIVINGSPKVENLKRLFPELYRAAPVLVANATPRS